MPFYRTTISQDALGAEILSDIRCIPVKISRSPHPDHKSLNEHVTSLYLSRLGQNDRESPNKVSKGHFGDTTHSCTFISCTPQLDVTDGHLC